MSKTYDKLLNKVIDDHLANWAAYVSSRAGLPMGVASVLDTDLSFSLQSDRLFRIAGPVEYALHLELVSGSELGYPRKLLRYNVAAQAASNLPVHSILLLLHLRAIATDQTEYMELMGVDDQPYLTFRYKVLRIWRESVSALLEAGLGMTPLALLTNEAIADLEGAFTRLRELLQHPDIPLTLAEDILQQTFVLSG